MNAATDARPTPRDSLLVAALGLAVYVALGQDAFHHFDSSLFVTHLINDVAGHHIHVCYSTIARGVHRLCAPLGLSPYESLRLASAAGTAIGLGFVHRAAADALPRRAALWTTTLVALCPGVLHFATVVEVHGVFFAFAGATFWLWTRLRRAASPSRALALGIGTGLATSVHASGHLLLGLHFAMALASWCGPTDGVAMPRVVRLFVVSLAGHFAVVAGVASLLQSGGYESPMAGQWEFLSWSAESLAALSQVGRVAGQEWLLPYLPASVAAPAAVLVARTRRTALLFCVCLAVYLALAFVLLTNEGVAVHERGAYFQPLGVAAALIVASAWGTRAIAVAAILAAALGAHAVVTRDAPRGTRSFASDVRSLNAESRVLLVCADSAEYRSVLRWAWQVPCVRLTWLVEALMNDPGQAFFDQHVAELGAAGRCIAFTEASVRAMRVHPPLSGFLDGVAKRYRLDEVRVGGLIAHRVLVR